MTAPAARLLVVRLGSLGDLIHTLPAVSAVARARPGIEIDWLVDAEHREILDLVPVLSTVVPLSGRTAGAWIETCRVLRARRYDVAMDFQGLLKSAALARLSGARRVIGFDGRALREPSAAWFYTERIAVGEGRHVIAKNLALSAVLGASPDRVEFPLGPVTSAAMETLRRQGLTSFALLNGGAAWPNKRWPAERFGRLARHLRARHGLQSVALWGRGEEDMAAAVVASSDGAALLAPETGLRDLVALSREARLMVSGDTGPTHIAAAVGTPIVALFGPTDPHRNGPWLPSDVVRSRYDACQCHYERRCRYDETKWCLGAVSDGEVCAAVDERLRAVGASPA